jgi:hypothetical protein
MRLDGSDRRQLVNDSVRYINVADDWIYYGIARGGREGASRSGLFKVRLDGGQRTLIANGPCYDINVVDGWIYYTNGHYYVDPKDVIYKVRTDGTDKTKLSEGDSIIVADDWCYTTVKGALYKMRPDGGGRVRLTEDSCGGFNVARGWIYYQNRSAGNKLFKIRTDGKDKVKLCEDVLTINGEIGKVNIYVVDQSIFYKDYGLELFRKSVKGGGQALSLQA